MSKYICQICGYVYDEEKEAARFADLPDSWTCPLCGAPKSQFKKAEDGSAQSAPTQQSDNAPAAETHGDDMRELTSGELAALCSNLARGCEKQYKAEEAALYSQLAQYYTLVAEPTETASFEHIAELAARDLEGEFPSAKDAAEAESDRGAKRALTWSEKVTRMTASILARYEKEGDAMLTGARVWVCDICGFIYIGDVPPAVCPICKVPGFKILEVARA